MSQEVAQWKVGDVILDLYEVTGILGEGGFGKVYKMRHTGWNTDLAVKIPKPSVVAAAGGVEKFEQEAETWVNLGLHPYVVSCYYVRRVENNPLVFAEYMAGGSLQDWIGERKLYSGGAAESLKRILDIAIQFAWGLHYAHEKGLIHQDVKPENVMLTPVGIVKVTDFGLANSRTVAAVAQSRLPEVISLNNESAGSTLMVEGSGAMTPAYCSPEQAKKETLTRRTDLWSWGLSVLEMFKGDRTWQFGTIAAPVLEAYLLSKVEDPQLPQMPMQVAKLLRRCFRENPDERPRNMLEVVSQLQEIYQEVTGEAYRREQPKAGKDTADSLNNRAVSFVDLGKLEQALQLWERALQLQPQHPESTYNRGLILWRTSRINDNTLVKEMENLPSLYGLNSSVNYLLSLVHLGRDDCEAAIETLANIQGEAAEQKEVLAAQALAKERLRHSKRLLRTFVGHKNRVKSVCLSADGQFALSGSDDLKWREVSTGKCLTQWNYVTVEYKNLVRSVCLSADGRFARSASSIHDKHNITLTLWELSTGENLIRSVTVSSVKSVESVCLSADGQFALSGSRDLKLWKVSTGECRRTFVGHAGFVGSVCLSADGRFALSGSDDKTLKLWELSTGEWLRTFVGHTNDVNSVCLSADGRFALSGSDDETLKLWELSTGECLRTFGHKFGRSVCLSADGRFALSGSSDNTLKLWEVNTGECLRTFVGHKYAVKSVCLSADGRFALSGSKDNTLKLWEISTGRCLRTFVGHADDVNSVCLSADGQFALSGSSDETLKLWEVNTGECLRTFVGHEDAVRSVCLSADGRFALSRCTDLKMNTTFKLWVLDWELDDREPADWDEGARSYLEVFLNQHTPYAAELPKDRKPTEKEITSALTRRGTPTWTEEDFQNLLYTLGCAGYGWLKPSGVRSQLLAMTSNKPMVARIFNPFLKIFNPAAEKVPSSESAISPEPSLVAPSPAPAIQPSTIAPNSQMAAKVTLTVTQGSLQGQEFVFEERTTCIIGRASDCNPKLLDNTISRYHCLLDINPPLIRVRDLGSLLGTYVNSELIGQRQSHQTPEEAAKQNFPEYDLKDGDEIKLSNTVFKVSIQGVSPDAAKIPAQPIEQQVEAGDPNLISVRGYTTLKLLGKGGCGAVYLARHDRTNELTALKVMLPQVATNQYAIDLFLRETENTKALQHPNVVRLRDYGYDEGTFFFSMEYCDGGSVVNLMQQRGGRLSVDEAVPIIIQVLDGLSYAHNVEIPYVKLADGTIGKGRGLVHRDLKPGNIFLSNVNGSRIAKIGDYGLAKAFDNAGLSGQTMSGTSAGTPNFMCRQQVLNFKYAKPEVDIWATAASLYYILTGKYPRDFVGLDPFAAILNTNPVPIRERDASIPKRLTQLIDSALVDNPEIYFKNAAALKRALSSVL